MSCTAHAAGSQECSLAPLAHLANASPPSRGCMPHLPRTPGQGEGLLCTFNPHHPVLKLPTRAFSLGRVQRWSSRFLHHPLVTSLLLLHFLTWDGRLSHTLVSDRRVLDDKQPLFNHSLPHIWFEGRVDVQFFQANVIIPGLLCMDILAES